MKGVVQKYISPNQAAAEYGHTWGYWVERWREGRVAGYREKGRIYLCRESIEGYLEQLCACATLDDWRRARDHRRHLAMRKGVASHGGNGKQGSAVEVGIGVPCRCGGALSGSAIEEPAIRWPGDPGVPDGAADVG